jgi:hypothetical protein
LVLTAATLAPVQRDEGPWPRLAPDAEPELLTAEPELLTAAMPSATARSDSPRRRIPLSGYLCRDLRYRRLVETDPTEAERVLRPAEEALRQRWQVCEEIAGRGAEHFPPDGRAR